MNKRARYLSQPKLPTDILVDIGLSYFGLDNPLTFVNKQFCKETDANVHCVELEELKCHSKKTEVRQSYDETVLENLVEASDYVSTLLEEYQDPIDIDVDEKSNIVFYHRGFCINVTMYYVYDPSDFSEKLSFRVLIKHSTTHETIMYELCYAGAFVLGKKYFNLNYLDLLDGTTLLDFIKVFACGPFVLFKTHGGYIFWDSKKFHRHDFSLPNTVIDKKETRVPHVYNFYNQHYSVRFEKSHKQICIEKLRSTICFTKTTLPCRLKFSFRLQLVKHVDLYDTLSNLVVSSKDSQNNHYDVLKRFLRERKTETNVKVLFSGMNPHYHDTKIKIDKNSRFWMLNHDREAWVEIHTCTCRNAYHKLAYDYDFML